MKRFDALLSSLPSGCIFDGELVVLDLGRSSSMPFRRRAPVYVAFDVLYADGEDLRPMPLSSRKSVLKHLLRNRNDVVVIDRIARPTQPAIPGSVRP
jgi:ATP-dependent DNA ligase